MGEPLDLSPPFLGTKSQLKHHGQDRLFAEASSGLMGPMSNRGKARFNRVGRPDVNPMLRRKVVEGQERFPIFQETFRGFRVFGFVGF